MRDHPGVLEERVEPAAVRRRMGWRRSKGGAGTVIMRRKKARMPSITESTQG